MDFAALVPVILAGATLAGALDPALGLPARLGAGIALGTLGTAVGLFVLLALRVPLAAAAAVPVLLALGWLLGYALAQRPVLTCRRGWLPGRDRPPTGGPPQVPAFLGTRPGPGQADAQRGPQQRRPHASRSDGPQAPAGTWAAARRIARRLGPPALETALLLVALVLLAGAGWLALSWPITTTDALRLFDGRARLLLTAGSLEGAAALAYDPAFFASYPPLTTLLYTWVYVLGGLARTPQYLSTLYTAATALLLYGLLRPQVARPLAAAATLALVASRQVLEYATNAYTVAPALCYTAGAVLLLDAALTADQAAPACASAGSSRRGVRPAEAGTAPPARPAPTGRLVLAGLCLGGAVWARTGSEPLVLALAALALWQGRRALSPAQAAAALLLPPLLLAGAWLGYAQTRLATVPPHETAALLVTEAQQAPPRELLTALRVLAQLPPQELPALVRAETLWSFARQFVPLVGAVDPVLLGVFLLSALLAWPAQRRQAFLWAVLAALLGTTAAGFFALFLVYPRSLQDTPDSVLRLLLLATPLLLAATARNLQATLDRGRAGPAAGRPSTPAGAPPAQEAAARPRPGWL
jgi:hypothetical protein